MRGVTRFVVSLSCWALFCVTSPSLSQHPYRWQNTDYLEQAFYEVALKNEYNAGGQFVRKWHQPVKIYLDHKVPDQGIHTKLARMHIKHLAYLTNHPIKIVRLRKDANVIWVYTRFSRWESDIARVLGKPSLKHAKKAVCIASFISNSNGQLVKGGIVIPVDEARSRGRLVGCVVEEITQMLGLPNDSDKVYPSIFNDRSPEELLSPLDVLLLKILYHPKLKAGMSKARAKPVVKAIIKEFKKNGTLDAAISEARKGELYPLMGF